MKEHDQYALKIRDLRKVYKNGHCALKGINLTVERGDFFALLGANGAGKSTTIGIISSLVNKTAGCIRIFGHDLIDDTRAAKFCIGIVPQELNFSQFENCLEIVLNQAGFYGVEQRVAMERAEFYLAKLGLWEQRYHCSRTLSGGMKRRLMIARGLIHQPKMLLLDEPTAGVDVELRYSMWDFLIELNEAGTTIVLTTHYLEEAERLCRNIAIIDQGNIVEHTSMKQLLAKLDRETLLLDTAGPILNEPVSDVFSIRKLDVQTLEVDIMNGQNLNDLFACLSKQTIEIVGVRNKSSRLETLFLNLLNNE